MKTQSKLNFHYSFIRLPEIIVWIISIIVFISVIFGSKLLAQEEVHKCNDTIWLKTGQVIPCKISDQIQSANYLSFSYKGADGTLVFDQVSKNKIQRYKRDVSTEETFMIMCKLELKDGAILSGNIISETETHINFYTTDIGLVKINRERVKKISPINAPKEIRKSFWFKNPHSTRLLFAPTAIPLKRGEGYYQNIYVYINMFNYGIIDNLSIGAGFDIITMFVRREGEWNPMLNFNIKSGFRVSKNLHLAAGGLYITMPGQFSAGILYGVGTAGNYNNNFTFGMGWGFVDGKFEEKPFIMFGGMARISERLWFVSENWVAPVDNSNYYFLLSYGLRISSRRVAVDIAFVNSKDIFEVLVIGVPYVDVVIKLGKNH